MHGLLELDYFSKNGKQSCIYHGDKMSTHDKQMALEFLTETDGQGCLITDEVHIDDTLGLSKNW